MCLFLELNEYVALLPLMVAFNVGNALKGGGFEIGYEVMDGATREKIWLRGPKLHFSIIQLREVKGKRT